MQPQGHNFRREFATNSMAYGGGWLIFGTLYCIGSILAHCGRLRRVEGESRDKVLRLRGRRAGKSLDDGKRFSSWG